MLKTGWTQTNLFTSIFQTMSSPTLLPQTTSSLMFRDFLMGLEHLKRLALRLPSKGLGQDISLRSTNPPNLTTLFPDLADLFDTTALTIEFQWVGYSPQSPVRAYFLLELRNDRFEGKGGLELVERTPSVQSLFRGI